MSDPLDYMNQLSRWPDPPEYDPKWARAVSAACCMIAERDKKIDELEEKINALEASLVGAGLSLYERCETPQMDVKR